jgi:hypothetical protein
MCREGKDSVVLLHRITAAIRGRHAGIVSSILPPRPSPGRLRELLPLSLSLSTTKPLKGSREPLSRTQPFPVLLPQQHLLGRFWGSPESCSRRCDLWDPDRPTRDQRTSRLMVTSSTAQGSPRMRRARPSTSKLSCSGWSRSSQSGDGTGGVDVEILIGRGCTGNRYLCLGRLIETDISSLQKHDDEYIGLAYKMWSRLLSKYCLRYTVEAE